MRSLISHSTRQRAVGAVPGQLVPAAGDTWLLPTIVRSEIDRQAGVPQIVTMEDSTNCIHASRGQWEPPHGDLLSEPAIVAGLA